MQNASGATSYAVLHPKRLPVKLSPSSVRLLVSLLTSSVTRHSDSLERSVIDTFCSAFLKKSPPEKVLLTFGSKFGDSSTIYAHAWD